MPDALQRATEALSKAGFATTIVGNSINAGHPNAVARIVLDAAGVQGLVSALEQIAEECDINDVPGIGNIALFALTTWRGEK